MTVRWNSGRNNWPYEFTAKWIWNRASWILESGFAVNRKPHL